VTNEKGLAIETQTIYELLEKKTPLYLRLNNITYQFDTVAHSNTLQIKETETYYKKCMDLGLTSLSSNTIAMISNNLIKNIAENESICPQNLS